MQGGYVGVDVFFVLSGFLITDLLLSAAAKRGSVSLVDFYTRRAKRILPAAALTLVVTDLVAYRLLNFVRAKEAMWDSVWSSIFAANIHFSNQATNYFARGQPPSPFQHYWSLAVEEQFYIVWPVVLALAVLFATQYRKRSKGKPATSAALPAMAWLFGIVVLIGATSLAWSIHETSVSPSATYFSTFARAWELGLGAALAIAGSTLSRIPALWRAVMGWIGLTAIVCAAVLFSSNTAFPGYAALLPTIGAALLICAGMGGRPRFGAGGLLSLRPMCYIGDRSYTFYLWHWPVLIIAAQYVGRDLSVEANMVLLFAAFLLSIFTYRFFENPIRRAKWSAPRAALLWPVSVGAVAVIALVTLQLIDAKSLRVARASAAVTSPTQHTASDAAALPDVVAAVRAAQQGRPLPPGLNPSPSALLNDLYQPGDCAAHDGETSSKICPLGDLSATRTIMVFGDSHAWMWMPAILGLAKQDGWKVVLISKSACTPDTWAGHQLVPRNFTPSWAECHAWYRWALGRVAALKPTVSLLAGAYSGVGAGAVPYVQGFVATTRAMKPFSKAVVVMGDTPRQTQQPVDCLLAHHATMKSCTAVVPSDMWQIDDDIASGVKKFGATVLVTKQWLCFQSDCPMVVGHTIVYRDEDHLTPEYALTLQSAFRTAFNAAILSQLIK